MYLLTSQRNLKPLFWSLPAIGKAPGLQSNGQTHYLVDGTRESSLEAVERVVTLQCLQRPRYCTKLLLIYWETCRFRQRRIPVLHFRFSNLNFISGDVLTCWPYSGGNTLAFNLKPVLPAPLWSVNRSISTCWCSGMRWNIRTPTSR